MAVSWHGLKAPHTSTTISTAWIIMSCVLVWLLGEWMLRAAKHQTFGKSSKPTRMSHHRTTPRPFGYLVMLFSLLPIRLMFECTLRLALTTAAVLVPALLTRRQITVQPAARWHVPSESALTNRYLLHRTVLRSGGWRREALRRCCRDIRTRFWTG